MRLFGYLGRFALGIFGLFAGLFQALWRGLTGYVPPDPVQQQRAAVINAQEADLDDEMAEIERQLEAERQIAAAKEAGAAKFKWGQPATDAHLYRPRRAVRLPEPEPANDDEDLDVAAGYRV